MVSRFQKRRKGWRSHRNKNQSGYQQNPEKDLSQTKTDKSLPCTREKKKKCENCVYWNFCCTKEKKMSQICETKKLAEIDIYKF